MDDAQIATLRERHSVAEDTDTDADGNLVYVQFCGWDDSDDWPCETAQLIAALEASRAECARLQAKLDDAMETLKPFARVSELGWSADSDRPQVVIISEGDICQAWQMIHVGSRWHPRAAINGAADATVGE